jgi:hypothetical protein
MTLRSSAGRALYALPGGLRKVLPQSAREAVRRRTGPFAPWESGFDHRPPKPAAGERPAAPDFVGIGVQKAGTTWWYELITSHPGVYRRAGVHKERHFFARFATQEFTDHEAEDYRGWFARPPGTLAGEWTPDYISQPWTLPLLGEAAPEARLLVILRDPVERFLSGLAHDARHGAAGGVDPLDAAFARGLYAAALEPWLADVPAERVLVLQYERCRADAAGELARTYRFLGLDDGYLPPSLERPQSPTLGPKPALPPQARRRLRDLYASDVARLVTLVPDLDLALWPEVAPALGR